uniref:Uncharacterized protein n=1 Tax=Romanomermis culicivorax TaxID=13658 RepID=A0A915JR92_ROMCU
MALCRTGTRESATFLSVHIARQMYLVHREVNPIGVMRYVRRHRHGAFTKTAKPPAQLKIVYGMLQNSLSNTIKSIFSSLHPFCLIRWTDVAEYKPGTAPSVEKDITSLLYIISELGVSAMSSTITSLSAILIRRTVCFYI